MTGSPVLGAERWKLFQPNNLSRVRPEFTNLYDVAERKIVQDILVRFYGVAVGEIDLLVGANSASRNYRVSTSGTTLFVKSALGEGNQDRLAQEGMRAEALRERGIPTPRIERASEGQTAVAGAGRSWLVSAYEAGDHFHGKGRELEAAGSAFAKLTQAAMTIEETGSKVAAQPPRVELLEVLALAKEAAWSEHDTKVSALCRANLPLLNSALGRIPADPGELGPIRPLHLDYHPLNLLMREEEVAVVLDLADILSYPIAAGVGFAGFKLIRQAMVDPELRRAEEASPSAVRRWMAGWNATFPEQRLGPEVLAAGARVRVLTLIRLILERLVRHGDDSLTFDLEKQIVSLVEIDWIFEGAR